jgi:hypothetical protein
MDELKRLQSQNAALFKQLDSKVVKQNTNKDHARYLDVLNVNGPDPETTTLLREQADNWLANPLAFWDRPMRNASNFGNSPQLSSQAQIIGYYMQAGSDSA